MILLQKCFLISDSGDVLIDPATCSKIVETIATPLKNDGEIELKDTCASFLAQIMPVICGDSRQVDLHCRMFTMLFDFSAENIVSDYLSEDTLWEVTTAWQDALSSEDMTLDQGLIDQCAAIVDKELKIFSAGESINLERFEKLAEICTKLMMCSTESMKRSEAERCKQIDVLLGSVVAKGASEKASSKDLMEKLAIYVELLNGGLMAKTGEYRSDLSTEAFTRNLRQLLVRELFCLNVVFKLSCNPKRRPSGNSESRMDHDGELDNEYDDGDAQMDDEENLIHCWSELIYEKVLSVIYSIAIGDTLLYSTNDVGLCGLFSDTGIHRDSLLQLDDTVETLIISLQERMALLLKNLPSEILNSIKQRLFRLANDSGLLWAKSLVSLLDTNQYSDAENGAILLYEDASTFVNSDDLITYINILQVRLCWKH